MVVGFASTSEKWTQSTPAARSAVIIPGAMLLPTCRPVTTITRFTPSRFMISGIFAEQPSPVTVMGLRQYRARAPMFSPA